MFHPRNSQDGLEDAATAFPRGIGRQSSASAVIQPMSCSVTDDDDYDGGGWLGSINTDFRSMATCFKDSTMPLFGGVMSLVRNAAMTVAAEIAQLEQDGEIDDDRCLNQNEVESLSLPWEIQQDCKISNDVQLFVTDLALMDLILALSMNDATFSTPYADLEPHCDSLSGDVVALNVTRKALIQRLLDADENLSDAHVRLLGGKLVAEHLLLWFHSPCLILICLGSWKFSGHHGTLEGVFWRNYFHHCDETREAYLKDKFSRKNQSLPNSTIALLNHFPEVSSENLSALSDEDMAALQDDSSLIPASVTDESSYVIYPSPNSGDSYMTTTSWGDLVLVGREIQNGE